MRFEKHKINDSGLNADFDVSVDCQKQILNILKDDTGKIKSVCDKYNQPKRPPSWKNGHQNIFAYMKRWIENRDVVVPIFKFSKSVRKIIYTTNAIENLNFG